MERIAVGIGFVLLLLVGPVVAAEGEEDAWISKIRKDHPRLFFNADSWPAVNARALTVEREHYERVKAHADGTTPEMWIFKDAPDARPGSSVKAGDWGWRLMSAAFAYRVEPDPERLGRIKDMLRASLDYYHACYAAKKAVNWYSTSRVSWLAALDWVWNDLTPAERKELGQSMLNHVHEVMHKPGIARRNTAGHTSGYYGARNALWFAGVVMLNESIDDEKALAFLRHGYDDYQQLFLHRSRGAGDDGGAASSTVTYAFAAYPWSAWNFLHTWQSAIGEDIAGKWPDVGICANYVMWNRLPGNLEYGYGDTPHVHNRFPSGWMYSHMSQVMHFYAESHPDLAALAAYVRGQFGGGHSPSHWSVYPFLMTNLAKAPKPLDPGKLPPARHFENMGQVFMRSGSGPEDTYAMFVCGATVTAHAHWDANHFVIYKLGHQALDSGTRYPSTACEHCNNYYRQTVAHNCVLIKMPEERGIVSYRKPIREGGQNAMEGSTVIAFETCPEFTYVAGDATAAYNPGKCSLMVRQFVFIPPDHFVVFDRATSTNADYPKKWVLHTAREPGLTGKQLRADQDRGRLFCRTLLPADAVIQKVGGPGKQFLTDDVNWGLEEKYYSADGGLKHELMGWGRVEVIPGAARTEDVFLHLLQVGDQKREVMCEAEVIQDDGTAGVRFTPDDRTVRLTFATQGEIFGSVRITRGAEVLIDRNLTREVMPQEGLATPPE